MAHRLQTLFLTLLLILGLTVFPVFAEEDDGQLGRLERQRLV